MKQILVTGVGLASLFNFICERLLKDGNNVICMDNYFYRSKTECRPIYWIILILKLIRGWADVTFLFCRSWRDLQFRFVRHRLYIISSIRWKYDQNLLSVLSICLGWLNVQEPVSSRLQQVRFMAGRPVRSSAGRRLLGKCEPDRCPKLHDEGNDVQKRCLWLSQDKQWWH